MSDILTPTGRLSFPALFTPKSFDGGEPKYDTTLLLPKKGTEQFITSLRAAVRDAAKEKWGDKLPANLRNPIRDGAEKPELDGFGEEVWFIRASSKNKVPVIDSAGNEVLVAGDVYPGIYARLRVRAFAYEAKGNKGVSFGLRAVQVILGQGKPLGGTVTADTAFKDFEPMTLPGGAAAGPEAGDDPFA